MNLTNQTNKKSGYPPYPEYPYSPPISGLFHNQTITNPNVAGVYSVYIPGNFDPCSPGVVILAPDNMSAQHFVESNLGQGWLTVANDNGVAVVVAEAYDAKTWNLNNSVQARDDEAFLKEIYDVIRDKSVTITAAFDLNERALYLVGYGEGGSAAHKMTMLWPQLFCGMATSGGSKVSDEIVGLYSGMPSYPFAQTGSLDGRPELNLPNGKIPMPVWIIESSDSSNNSGSVKDHWIAAAGAVPGAANAYAQQVYENGPVRIWITSEDNASAVTPGIIYSEYLSQVQRFMPEPGGILEWSIRHTNENGKGFFFTETEVNGFLRRWLTYIPRSYNETVEYPLVLAIHGGTSVTTAFTGDSRWQDVAEQYGFIVVFPQAYPVPMRAPMETIPAPIWRHYGGILVDDSAPDDVAFIKEVVARTKKAYNIDARRIYATGHSNGSGMTWRLGIDSPEIFSAIAPVGLTMGSYIDDVVPLDVPLPVWVFMGRYDLLGADQFEEGNFNDRCLKYWGVRNGFDPSSMTTGYDSTGRYYIRTWTNGTDTIPLFHYATVNNCPHAYVPSLCELVWRNFFMRITREPDGKRYFDGQEIKRG
jgi:polyhydroxybutyrate depolymerase